jgi:hypothetical protein
MPRVTVRSFAAKAVQALKAFAKRQNRSMGQKVPARLEGHAYERRDVLDQIEAGWTKQARRPTAVEVDRWMGVGRV